MNSPLAHDDEGSGPTLVLLHGLGANRSCWSAQAEAFSDSWRVIRPDIRGFGGSEKRGPYSIRIFADDIIALLDQLDAWPAVIVGTSMGGYIALQLALQERARVRQLVLCHTACSRRVPPAVMADRLAALRSGTMTDYARVAIKHALAPGAGEALVQRVVEMIGANDKSAFVDIFAGDALDFDLCDQLSSLSLPTCIISSEDDKVVPYARALELQQHITGAQLKVIPETGHLSYMEQPGAFNRALREFLSQ